MACDIPQYLSARNLRVGQDLRRWNIVIPHIQDPIFMLQYFPPSVARKRSRRQQAVVMAAPVRAVDLLCLLNAPILLQDKLKLTVGHLAASFAPF